jgi:hypothetical protein
MVIMALLLFLVGKLGSSLANLDDTLDRLADRGTSPDWKRQPASGHTSTLKDTLAQEAAETRKSVAQEGTQTREG